MANLMNVIPLPSNMSQIAHRASMLTTCSWMKRKQMAPHQFSFSKTTIKIRLRKCSTQQRCKRLHIKSNTCGHWYHRDYWYYIQNWYWVTYCSCSERYQSFQESQNCSREFCQGTVQNKWFHWKCKQVHSQQNSHTAQCASEESSMYHRSQSYDN